MPLIGALIVKEFQTWLRGRLTFAAFSALVVFTSLLFFLLAVLILSPDANAAPALYTTTTNTASNPLVPYRGVYLFGAVGLCVLLAAAVVAPAVSASAFAAERERGTLDLLLMQGPGTGRVVFGKVLAGFIFSLLVLGIAAPLFPAAWSFGGVGGEQVLTLVSVVLVSTLLYCALGVFFGAVLRSALQAAFLTQAVAFFLLFGTLGLHLAATAVGGSELFKPLLWLSPVMAVLSAGGAAMEVVGRQVPNYRLLGTLAQVTWLPGLAFPAWILACALWSMLAAGLVLVTAVVIDPCHPLKTRRRA